MFCRTEGRTRLVMKFALDTTSMFPIVCYFSVSASRPHRPKTPHRNCSPTVLLYLVIATQPHHPSSEPWCAQNTAHFCCASCNWTVCQKACQRLSLALAMTRAAAFPRAIPAPTQFIPTMDGWSPTPTAPPQLLFRLSMRDETGASGNHLSQQS